MAEVEETETTTNKETSEEQSTEEPKGPTEEEVNKRVEAARKQEKDKLYGEIDDLKTVVKELRDNAREEREAKQDAEKKAEVKADDERKAKLSAEDRLAENMKAIEEKLAKEADQRRRLEQELKDERARQELEVYRQELLRQAGEEIIPDLVVGNNKEDIDRSVARAKSRYQELFESAKTKAEGKVRGNMPRPTDPEPAAIDEAELQNSLQNFNIDIDRYYGNRKKGVARDDAYRAQVDAQRQAVLDKVSAAYRSASRRG